MGANEESVHAFYLTQMESLLSEKVASLQEYINEWEKKLLADKAEAVEQLKSEHNQQLESLRKHFSQLEAKMQASDEVHRASKREAEILKGQLHGSQATVETEDNDDEDIMSLNNRQRPKRSLSKSTAMVNCHRINNLRDRPQTSAGGSSSSDKAKLSLPEFSLESPTSASLRIDYTIAEEGSSSSVLSLSEKKDLVQTFIKQFLEDYPEAVLDSKMMEGLSAKANALIDRSFQSLDE